MGEGNGIPSPFNFDFGNQRPPAQEVIKRLDEVAKSLEPGFREIGRIVGEYNLGCFEMEVKHNGISVALHIHNPKMHPANMPMSPHDDDMMGDPTEMLQAMGLIPPGAKPIVMMGGRIPLGDMRMPNLGAIGRQNPAPDLLAGIEEILKRHYPEAVETEVMGAIMSPHHNAAMDVGKVLEAARQRDRNEIRVELERLVARFRP